MAIMSIIQLHLKIHQELLFLQALAEQKNITLNFQVENIPEEGIEVIVDIAGHGIEFFDQVTINSEEDWTQFSEDIQFALDLV